MLVSTPATAIPKRTKRLPVVAIVVVVLVVAAAVAYFGFGTGKSPGTSASGNPTVNIANGTGSNQSLNFSPQTITVVIGKNNTVVFVNNDVTQHTVSFSSGPSGVTLSSISDPSLAKGSSFTVTLTVAGTYNYKCFIHPWMYGKIIVKAS